MGNGFHWLSSESEVKILFYWTRSAASHVVASFLCWWLPSPELRDRVTAYERNHNICRFIYSTPFTVDGVSCAYKKQFSPSGLLAPWILYLQFIKLEFNPREQKYKAMYPCPAAPWRACRAVQEENYSHHGQPLPLHQNQDTGAADWFSFALHCTLDRWLTRSRSSWPQLRWPSRTFRWRSTQQ